MKWVSLFAYLTAILFSYDCIAQPSVIRQDFTLLESRMNGFSFAEYAQEDTTEGADELPKPRSVLYKSLIIPGWGQVINRQIWKVPVIYGLFAGIGVYTVYLDGQYKDYRAAYYNATQGEDNDFRFGPTPERLEGVNQNQLQSNRNSFRNQRDFMVVVFGLAYALNALDAYVYAHMRSFDVSDDLAAQASLEPTFFAEGRPGVQIRVSLFNK